MFIDDVFGPEPKLLVYLTRQGHTKLSSVLVGRMGSICLYLC